MFDTISDLLNSIFDMLLTCFYSMKELIFCVTFILCAVICLVLFIFRAMNFKKLQTSRHFKICRNLCVAISVTAFIAAICLPSFSFDKFLSPILTVPVFLLNAKNYHEAMLNTKELEGKVEAYLKTQPIDVEYKELN